MAKVAGDIDILVNNAGMYVAKGWFEETAYEWTSWYNSNVSSMVRMNNRLVPQMKAKGWGRVIAIASRVATKPQTSMPGYSATKVANISLAVSLAHALAGSGVTSNAVSPGIIITGGLEAMFDQMGVPKDAGNRAKLAAGFHPDLSVVLDNRRRSLTQWFSSAVTEPTLSPARIYVWTADMCRL